MRPSPSPTPRAGLDVVAEGIEHEARVEERVRLGRERGPGFHLARPDPPGDLERGLAVERGT